MVRPIAHIGDQITAVVHRQLHPVAQCQLINQRTQDRHQIDVGQLIAPADAIKCCPAPFGSRPDREPGSGLPDTANKHFLAITLYRNRLAPQDVQQGEGDQLLGIVIGPYKSTGRPRPDGR